MTCKPAPRIRPVRCVRFKYGYQNSGIVNIRRFNKMKKRAWLKNPCPISSFCFFPTRCVSLPSNYLTIHQCPGIIGIGRPDQLAPTRISRETLSESEDGRKNTGGGGWTRRRQQGRPQRGFRARGPRRRVRPTPTAMRRRRFIRAAAADARTSDSTTARSARPLRRILAAVTAHP